MEPMLAGIKLRPERSIRKRGRCIKLGTDMYLVNPDDYKQLCRGINRPIAQKRLKNMKIISHIPLEPLVPSFKPPLASAFYEARFEMLRLHERFLFEGLSTK